MTKIEFLRQFRIGGYAVFDFAVSFIGTLIIGLIVNKLLLKTRVRIPLMNWLYFTIPASIIFHLAFNTMTPMTKNFVDLHGHYLLKIIILGLLFLSFWGIKILPIK